MMTLTQIGVFGLGGVAAAAASYLIVEQRWRWRWREVEIGRAPIGDPPGGAYRQAGTVPVFMERAPRLVRLAAFSSIAWGQWCVPLLLLALLLLLAGGLGVLLIPGVIGKAKLYRAGLLLLRRTPQPLSSVNEVRDAANWAFSTNGLVLGASMLLSVATGEMVIFVIWGAYSMIGITQALLLRRAAIAYEDALFIPSRDSP
jgi:hypothetical protein